MRHKGETHEGQHEAIISDELWEAAQTSLKSGRAKRTKKNIKHINLLEGKCFGPGGEIFSPTYTAKTPKQQYRYYQQKDLNHRIKAEELEALILNVVASVSPKPDTMIESEATQRWQNLWSVFSELRAQKRQKILDQIIEKIIITKTDLTILLSYQGIGLALTENAGLGKIKSVLKPTDYQAKVAHSTDHIEIHVIASFRNKGRNQIAVDGEGRALAGIAKTHYNEALVSALVQSYQLNRMLNQGQATITKLAEEKSVARSYVGRIVNLMFLSPDIITAIFNGTQPRDLQLKDLMINLPKDWDEQRRLLGLS